MFTEDYQVDFLKEYHKVFDTYRKKYLVGEMVWNFADFMTAQSKLWIINNLSHFSGEEDWGVFHLKEVY